MHNTLTSSINTDLGNSGQNSQNCLGDHGDAFIIVTTSLEYIGEPWRCMEMH